MKVYRSKDIKKYNAFKVSVKAKYFAFVRNKKELIGIIGNPKYKNIKKFILSEGANTLFTNDYDGFILKNEISGKKVLWENEEQVLLEIGAGEDWIKFVDYTLENNWAGVENLSYIPGAVGAAPVQNIAAYGQNFEDVFESLDAVDLQNGDSRSFNKSECKFGYRSSIFKEKLKGKYFITQVRIKLSKFAHINTTYHSRYGSLESELQKFAKPPYSIKDISKAVINIRKTKFPDWTKLGTAGSFFLNPVITKKELEFIQKKEPDVQYYPVDKLTYPRPDDPGFDHSNYVKVAAGWLLDALGWKGKRIGKVGTSPNQALVLINYGDASAEDILNFSELMKQDFYKNYKIKLEPEIVII